MKQEYALTKEQVRKIAKGMLCEYFTADYGKRLVADYENPTKAYIKERYSKRQANEIFGIICPGIYDNDRFYSREKGWNHYDILDDSSMIKHCCENDDMSEDIELLAENIWESVKEYQMSQNVTLLNCAILTSEGNFTFTKASLETVKEIISNAKKITSAIGHQSTADILSKILGTSVPMNRIQYHQKTSDIAIVFKLNKRPPEGKILSEREIKDIGFSFGILKKF